MVDIDHFRKPTLSFADATEELHFHLTSFRYKGKIFATWWETGNRAMVKLTPEEQSVFCSIDEKVFFPVNGTWGQKGATFVDLGKVRKDMFKDALALAYEGVTKKKKM